MAQSGSDFTIGPNVLAAIGALGATIATITTVAILFFRANKMNKDQVQEITQSALAFIYSIGGGYLLAFHPEIDRAIVIGLIAPVITLYFGAKIALSTPSAPPTPMPPKESTQ